MSALAARRMGAAFGHARMRRLAHGMAAWHAATHAFIARLGGSPCGCMPERCGSGDGIDDLMRFGGAAWMLSVYGLPLSLQVADATRKKQRKAAKGLLSLISRRRVRAVVRRWQRTALHAHYRPDPASTLLCRPHAAPWLRRLLQPSDAPSLAFGKRRSSRANQKLTGSLPWRSQRKRLTQRNLKARVLQPMACVPPPRRARRRCADCSHTRHAASGTPSGNGMTVLQLPYFVKRG